MADREKLYLRFHGRIIDSLGIQMYQSPVAAIAELIANAWDADATEVDVQIPRSLDGDPNVVVHDNGRGMTFKQCQEWYLNVGRNRRVADADSASPGGRPVLGRKGIGKFAGFGIAETLNVDTTSEETGERTAFQLDLNRLRGNDYVDTDATEVPLVLRKGPSERQNAGQGETTVTLAQLKLNRAPSEDQFRSSMARRFLVKQNVDNFTVKVNGSHLPQDNSLMGAEFDFPSDYRNAELPEGLLIDDHYGAEKVDGQEIRWRIRFTRDPIGIDELRGVAVFCGIKVAQTPFFFNLSGGLSGQHGQQYISGHVQADYLDRLDADIITTERQRVNWEHRQARPLERWGQERVKSLLAIWKARRAEDKLKSINDKAKVLSPRLERLGATERQTVSRAIKKVATIEALSQAQFTDLANGILTAWEAGRLHELIGKVASVETMDEGGLLELLAEAQVLNALQVAETVRAKVEIVRGLRKRIESRELENEVRDYIADNPWLLSPEWETFKKETGVGTLVKAAAAEAGCCDPEYGRGRIDLVMSSGWQLLVVEFMRPGLAVDRDHVNRFQAYIDILRSSVRSSTAFGFRTVSGLLVADSLNKKQGLDNTLRRLEQDDMRAIEWQGLLERAEAQWADFLSALVERDPEDERLSSLRG